MKKLLSRLLILCAVGSLLALQSCQTDEDLVTPSEPIIEQHDGMIEVSGAEVIKTVESVHGDVSKMPFEEVLTLYFQIKDEQRLREGGLLEKARASSQDVYSTFLSVFTIPYQGAPPNQWTTWYDPTPPIIGLPPVNDTRTLIVNRCPGFFQITSIANAYKNNVSLSGQSATESFTPSCGSGRQFQAKAQATITTFGSATTLATISCRNVFCPIVAEEAVRRVE